MPGATAKLVARGRKTHTRQPRGGLNRTERKQVADIAKRQVKLRSETKQRPWLYPKTPKPQNPLRSEIVNVKICQ